MTEYHRFPDEIKPQDPGRYLGMNIVKWCALCAKNKPQLGGTLRFVMGGRHWICKGCK